MFEGLKDLKGLTALKERADQQLAEVQVERKKQMEITEATLQELKEIKELLSKMWTFHLTGRAD